MGSKKPERMKVLNKNTKADHYQVVILFPQLQTSKK